MKCFREIPPIEPGEMVIFAPWNDPEGSWIISGVPISRYLGVLTDKILPIFQKVRTMEDAYAHHKAIVSQGEKALIDSGASYTELYFAYNLDLLTEAVYFDDREYLEAHRAGMMRRMETARSALNETTKSEQKKWAKDYSRYEMLFAAMDKGEREPFLAHLEKEKKKNLAKLERMVFNYG